MGSGSNCLDTAAGRGLQGIPDGLDERGSFASPLDTMGPADFAREDGMMEGRITRFSDIKGGVGVAVDVKGGGSTAVDIKPPLASPPMADRGGRLTLTAVEGICSIGFKYLRPLYCPPLLGTSGAAGSTALGPIG